MRRRDFLTTSAAMALGLAVRSGDGAAPAEERGIVAGPAAKLTPPETGLITVAFAISEGTTNIDWVGPEAVFQTWHFDPALKKHTPRFKLVTVSEKLEPVSHMVPQFTFDTVPAPNIVVIPNQQGSAALVDWLRAISRSADVTMSVCTGAAQLAKAGLLNGKSATTHHEALEQFATRYPDVKWVRARFVEGDKISTGGGLTAGIDLALRVTERYFGREEAQKVADHLEYQCKGWIVDS